ncbi:MAG: leucine-rich repeat protein [Bacteroidales bacterium]|nr:leucine-rich repeat protein [Bacteroidales bacterium]
MKKIFTILVAAAALVQFAACNKVEPVAPVDKNTVTLTATLDTPTRTALVAGNKVEWLAGDVISLFDGTVNTEISTTGSGASATFTAALATAGPWYALYPYATGASIDAGVITTTLPAAQTAVAGTFADDLNIAVALSDGSALAFKNVLGLIKFTVGADADIVKVTLTGNNSEVLAGTVEIDYNAGEPTYTVTGGAATAIELTGTFVQGSTYYFAVLPQTFTNGFTLTYTNSSDVDRVETTTNEMVLGRSQIRNIGSPDIIVFADPEVKAALVAHFDTNGDGELSKAEAEAVTYNAVEGIVGGDKNADVTALWGADLTVINTFDELKYFTGLINTAQGNRHQLPILFKDCTNLTSVKIPDNITHISNYAFYGCSSLASVVLPSGLTSIFSNCFNGCSALESISVPSTLTQISASGFTNCTSLTHVYGFESTQLTALNNYTFQNCTSLDTIGLPTTLRTIGAAVFEGCAALRGPVCGSSVTDALTSIGNYAFSGCENITFGSRNFRAVTTVGKGAFANCKKVSNFTMNNAGYQNIQDSTFFGCSGLVTIRVSNNLTNIGQHAFNGCTKLTTFSNTGTSNGFVLPPDVNRIRNYAFSDCRVLASANTPAGVPDFSNNTALTRIDDRAFRYCAAFTTVVLPETVSYIRRAFGSSSGTRTMTMVSLKIPYTTAVVDGSTASYLMFEGWEGELPTILVPASLVDDYKAAAGWSTYAAKIEGF